MMGKMEMRSAPGNRPRDGRHCDLCGCSQPAVRCDKCGCQIFCLSCDDMYHRHPKRRFHLRKAVDPMTAVPQARPVLPVKVSHLNATNPGDPSKMPLPPPRKKKSLFGSFRKPSPSSDNSPPLPRKEYSWTDRLGSIKKFMSNRPLPPLPTSDDNDREQEPTTNGQSIRGDLSFIHRRNEERPPQLPQRSPKSPEFPGLNKEKDNRIPNSTGPITGQVRNGSLEPNTNHMNQNREFPSNEENHWNNRMNNQNGPQAFGTLNRQGHQRGFMPPGVPGYPGGMHLSSSATDLHSMHNAEAMPGPGPVPPHYPHYPMNPHMPPHYPYPMYHPQFPNYPQYFGNSFANLSQPPTSDGDVSDSESASKHSSKRHQFRKRAKRSQSVMVDRMAYPGQYFPFGPYPGYGPWGAPMPMEAPPSPASSVRSLTRTGRTRRRKKMTSEDDDEEFSVSSSPMSRPKSSSSDPKEQPRAPLATQTTSSEDESDENISKRNKTSTIRQIRQPEPISAPSPVTETNNTAKVKQSSSKQSDSDTRGTPDIRSEKRQSMDSTTESPQPVQQKTSAQSIPPDFWECRHCTFINPIGNRICQVCCKTATPRTVTPVTLHSRPSSAAAASSRKESVGSEQECSSPNKVPEIEEDVEKKDRQDMASLNSALDEAEKQITRGLEELMKLKDDIDANISKEKPKPSENQFKPETQETSKPVYKSSGRMRTSILDKLNLNKPQASNTSVSTCTETQTGQNSWTSDKIIEARRHSNSSTTSETYNSPLAQSPDLERSSVGNKQKRDSSCQTQQDTIAEYLEKRKAAEEAFLGRSINNFGFGYGDRMDMVTSPVPSMYDRFYGGGYGLMQRSHSRASLFAGRPNEFGPMEYGGPGFGYGPTPMYRSVSRSSLTGEYPDGRMSDFHNLRKPDFYLSMEELVERRRQDNIRAQGLELVRMIREAEQQGFNADDIQVALTHCGKQNPLEWLQENWRNMVDSVLTLSTNYGNDKKENDIGLLSENEARDALRLHKGNVWAAVTECVEGRQRKYLELSARGNFSRQDIVDALTSSDGDVEMAYAKLTKSTGKPFLMRIWGAGEGAQNQDGAQPILEDFHGDPRLYLKDETLKSDEMSEELWSEDGEWDDEEVYEEEDRGDIEDLQTCHEDLQTSPQEMRTPESDKSDYCDAFPIDDRNTSSPSDDIFFVIQEAKPEKKKGFLSKLAALRKDSKEQDYATSSAPKDGNAPEQNMQEKEDEISQKSNSSSEQPKNNGALSTLKNTLSAIKDSVTGGSKSDKKVPCAQPEKRTIIVKGQINHESLNYDSKENVQLTSVKLLEEKIASSSKSENELNEPAKLDGDSLTKETNKIDQGSISLNTNFKDNNQSQLDKNNSDYPSNKVESKSKIENKKHQSLAERLKFAKQTRSTANAPSTSAIQKETSVCDTKIKGNSNIESNKELTSNQLITKSPDIQWESEIKLKTVTLNQYQKDVHDITEIHKIVDIIPNANNSTGQSTPQSNVVEAQNNVITSDAEIPNRTSPSVQSQGVTNEINAMKSATSSKNETLSAKQFDSKSMSQTEQETKNEEVTIKKSDIDIRPQSVSPIAKSLNEEKILENNSHKNSIEKIDINIKNQDSNVVKPGDEQKSDIVKTTSSLSDNNLYSELAKAASETEEKSKIEVTMEQIPATSFSAENIPVISNKKDLKESTPEAANDTDKMIQHTSNTHSEESDTKINIPQTLNEPSETPTIFEDTKSSHPETSSNKNYASADSLIKDEGSKAEELNTTITETRAIMKSQNATENIATLQNSATAENSPSTKDSNTNTCEEILGNQLQATIETISTQSENKPTELDTYNNLQEKNKAENISTENHQNFVSKPEVVSEIISTSQSNQQIKNFPIASCAQNIPENMLEQPIRENSKTQINFNSVLEAKTVIQLEISELHKLEQINSDVNSNITEKDMESEQIAGPSQTFVQDNESPKIKDADTKSIQNVEVSENSKISAEANLNEDLTPLLAENKKDYRSTTVSEAPKIGKFKSTKVSKIKKSLERGKYESKDKTEVLTSLPSSQNKSVPTEKDNNTTNGNNVSSKGESISYNETRNEPFENKALTESNSLKKEAGDKEKLENNISQDESKVDTNEKNIRTTEETKIQTSNEEKKSLTVENSENSSKSEQSAAFSTELQSITSALGVTDPSTSKVEQTEIQKVPTGSETEQTTESSKEIVQISSEIDNNTVSVETELQKLDVSKDVHDNKNRIITHVDTSKNNFATNRITTETINSSVQDNLKMMAPVSSKTFPDKSKKMTSSSNIAVPDNNKTMEATSSTNVLDNSKVIPSSSNTTVLNNSNIIASSSNETVSDNNKTMEDNSIATVLDNTKAIASSSNITVLDNSDIIASSNITVSDSNKTVEASSSTTVFDNSKVIPSSSNATVLKNSKVIASSSNAVHDNLKTMAATSSAIILDSSEDMEVSSNTTDSDVSNTTEASEKTVITNSSKTIEASTSTALPDNSDKIASASLGNSKTITDTKTLNKVNKEMDVDTESFSVQNQAEQHSNVPDNTTIDTSLTKELSSTAGTVPKLGRFFFRRTLSQDDSTSQAVDSDDADIHDSDESWSNSVTPPSPVDALRSRFEGLAGGAVRGGPIRPASPFRRMSFNSRKQVIALERKRDTSADKPWFRQKVVKEPVKIPLPKRSIKQQLEMERKVRKMVADRKCRTYRKAEIVVQLMDMNFEEDEAIQAANECSTLEQAISYLQQECLLCAGYFPVSQIISMTHCEHRACRECIRAYFTVQIRDRTILDLLCPFCNEPDIGDEDVAQDYFNHLDIMLKKLVDVEIHELFQRKLRDRVLMKDPNFRWCSQCSSGFISMPNLKRLICPDCNAVTCAICRRLWEKEHQGISCEAFAALKDASDPEAQAAGLAKLLTEDGIDCPSCHFRYALAKGGCMHFRCIQCQHDFCSGCSRPFKMGQKCGVSEFCGKLGLHAHHPRNCLFYLRDKEPEDLQKLLDMSDVKYNREPPEGMELRSTCQVMEQKETPDGMIDDYCGKEVQDGYAGLCRVHYVEYLGQLVNKYKVDPIQIFDSDDLELVLRRANIRLPPKKYRETDMQYRDKLVNLIQEELPLDKTDGS